MNTALAAVAVASFVAAGIAAVSGFGIGSVLTPLLLLWFPAPEAVALVALPHALASSLRWFRLRGDVHMPTFVQFGIASALGGLAGALLQLQLGGAVLKVLLGGLILAAGIGELLERRLPIPPTALFRLTGGALSGFFGGLVGNQGGVRTAALLGFSLTPRQLVATSTASAVLVDIARVPVYVVHSADTLRTQLPLLAASAVAVVLGTYLGVPLLSHLRPAAYRRIVGVLLVLLALGLIGSAVAVSLPGGNR